MSCKHEWSPWSKIVADVAADVMGITISYACMLRACKKCMIVQARMNKMNYVGDGDDKADIEETKAKRSKAKRKQANVRRNNIAKSNRTK